MKNPGPAITSFKGRPAGFLRAHWRGNRTYTTRHRAVSTQQDPMTKTAVVALGGNALTLPGQAGTCEEMLARAADMAASVNDIIEAGWRVVIVHGNGPQV